MSKPDDIPQDVLERADALWTDLANFAGGHTRAGETLLIARAIMAERMRCANLAGRYIDPIDIAHFIRIGREA